MKLRFINERPLLIGVMLRRAQARQAWAERLEQWSRAALRFVLTWGGIAILGWSIGYALGSLWIFHK